MTRAILLQFRSEEDQSVACRWLTQPDVYRLLEDIRFIDDVSLVDVLSILDQQDKALAALDVLYPPEASNAESE